MSYAQSVSVQGRFAFVADFGNSSLVVFDIGGAYIQQLEAGGVATGSLSTHADLEVGGDADVKGGLTVGPGGALLGGDVAVEGMIRAGKYIQFPVITGAAPSAADCSAAGHAGRVIIRTDGAINLYVCTGAAWIGK